MLSSREDWESTEGDQGQSHSSPEAATTSTLSQEPVRQYNLTFSGASWSPFIVGDVGGGRNDEKLSWSEGKREFKYRDLILSRLHTPHSAVLTLEPCSVMTNHLQR